MSHVVAVIMFSQTGSIALDVVYVTPDEDSDDQNVDYEDENGFRYRLI